MQRNSGGFSGEALGLEGSRKGRGGFSTRPGQPCHGAGGRSRFDTRPSPQALSCHTHSHGVPEGCPFFLFLFLFFSLVLHCWSRMGRGVTDGYIIEVGRYTRTGPNPRWARGLALDMTFYLLKRGRGGGMDVRLEEEERHACGCGWRGRGAGVERCSSVQGC